MKKRILPSVLAALLFFALLACSPAAEPIIPSDNSLRIGIAPFTQPAGTSDLMAGYTSDMTPRLSPAAFLKLDSDFAALLGKMSKRGFIEVERARAHMERTPKKANMPAFDYWLLVGRLMGLDLLIVPQIHSMQERQGGEMGASRPAAVSMDFFLLDIPNKALLARSRYDERQRPLLDNLMDIDKFISRRGQWVDVETLAKEGMYKAIKDFGL